ncbi:MAG: hypothetical protein AVDCRST_MAG71-1199 [uncultured Lysobacter sp.]|uniref:DUF2272 domain-containing protein n=1 Tax=uncultured Lysobacter sp. TaxID=271060 RepID=A0A6J4L173_9GAMM|nr:MAG: hypothetical protein AVDCRST_MAG71-1199 [uncultured Lysobacter sp.]
MHARRVLLATALLAACITTGDAVAARCGSDASGRAIPDVAARIAAVACAEHRLWFEPFIDLKGRLASVHISEAESAELADGITPAWRRVTAYWQASGVQWPPSGYTDGADCFGTLDEGAQASLCRTFLLDTPWSAVFVSYVMRQAGVQGFRASTRHVDYVRDAQLAGSAGPFRLVDPESEAPAPGDLLCFTRLPDQAFGHDEFVDWLQRPFSGALAMHCDIVVAVDRNHARLIGGNVLHGVTMRMLPVNRSGRFWSLAGRTAQAPACTPDRPDACDFNRQDWVALLKLNPVSAPTAPPASPCCEVCALPMPAGMQRCPIPTAPRVGTAGAATR